MFKVAVAIGLIMSDDIEKKLQELSEARQRIGDQLRETTESLDEISIQIDQLHPSTVSKSVVDELSIKLVPEDLTIQEIIATSTEPNERL
jgi:uncharacterized coiled-coil DUF342 family protein